MKTMMLTGIREMELVDTPEPRIKNADDVIVRMRTVGVCGSDVHYYSSGGIGKMRVRFPFTVGHEGAGEVCRTGSGVTDLVPGDRIAVEPAISCYDCDQCLAGRPNTCRKLRFVSCPGEEPGCLSEYILVPARNCHKIPAGVSFEQASLSEPLSIALYSVKRSAHPVDGASVILGAGPIGLAVSAVLQAAGPGPVYMTEKVPERSETARSAGAEWVGNPDMEDVVAGLRKLVPEEPETVFECCGDQQALDQAVEMLRPGGRLMIVGIPEEQRYSFDVDLVRRKEITIYYVRRQCGCVDEAVEMISSGRIDLDFMITHRFPLERTAKAFRLLDSYEEGIIKAIINI